VRLPAYRKTAQREYRGLLSHVKAAQREARAGNDGDSGQGDRHSTEEASRL
jgi:hypothetical protein